MRFCISAILVSLTSRGACAEAEGEAFTGGPDFLPPVSHMMAIMRNATLTRTHDWTFFGRRPCGFGVFSCTSTGWVIGISSVRVCAPRKRQFLFADREVAGVDDLGRDVNAVLDLERNQVRFAVLDFIERGFFARGALDVGKRIVVVDGGD